MTQESLEKGLALSEKIAELKQLLIALDFTFSGENILTFEGCIDPIIIVKVPNPKYIESPFYSINSGKSELQPERPRLIDLKLDKELKNLLVPFLIEKTQSRLEILEKELLEL